MVDEPVGQGVHISLGDGVKEHQLQQLVVVKDLLAVLQKAPLQPGAVAVVDGHSIPLPAGKQQRERGF